MGGFCLQKRTIRVRSTCNTSLTLSSWQGAYHKGFARMGALTKAQTPTFREDKAQPSRSEERHCEQGLANKASILQAQRAYLG
jgi:hypothetical protein